MDFANTFLKTPFHRTHLVAAPVKACNFTSIRLRHRWFFVNNPKRFWTYLDALLEFSKSSQKDWQKFPKYLSADGCSVKTNTTNCDDNNDADCFLILGHLPLLRQLMKQNFSRSTRAIHLCSSLVFLCRLKVWFAKKWRWTCVWSWQINLLQTSRPCKNSNYFQKVVQLFNLMRDNFPIRDSNRLECITKSF